MCNCMGESLSRTASETILYIVYAYLRSELRWLGDQW